MGVRIMGKISPVSAKYIIQSTIKIDGVVDRPDVIGAIFGQTEGLLGSDLELRELQRSGRIGRIEVKSDIKAGKSSGAIIIPSSLDKAETAIIAASLETITRIGPCNAKIVVDKIEDVRISKRNFVVERAKELLKHLTENVLPDSQDITDEVSASVRMMEVVEYGPDKLPAGPAVEESEDILLVEGRADVLNLLKHGIKNSIALNGTNMPPSIVDLASKKTITLFVDGDRGGDLIIREVASQAEIDFIIKAPDGKEVEELAKKEIHKALRSKVTVEQAMLDIEQRSNNGYSRKGPSTRYTKTTASRPTKRYAQSSSSILQVTSDEDKEVYKKMLDDLVGTRGAYLLDKDKKVLGKVPITELVATLKDMKGISIIIFDGIVNKGVVTIAEKLNLDVLVAMDSKINQTETKVKILTNKIL